MRIKCDYCGSFIDDTAEKCPFCGGVNSHLARSGAGIPKTIEALIEFAKAHNLPLEKMHYHLGENYTGPKAIGIYQDEETRNFVVYKNKADGSRAVRYEGKDEAYAVNEIYQKMKTDMISQKEQNPNAGKKPSGNSKGGLSNILFYIMIAIVIIVILGGKSWLSSCLSSSSSSSHQTNPSGYYRDYDDDDDDSGWFDSNDDDSWWNSNDNDNSWNDSDWNNSDWNWGSDNWNSGGSDWNSNW